MSEEQRAVKVKLEEGRKLVVEMPEGKENTYHLNPIRTLRLNVVELQVGSAFHRLGLDPDPGNDGSGPVPAAFVRGTAFMESGTISVIGDPGSAASTLSISFHAPARPQPGAEKPSDERYSRGDHVLVGLNRKDWEIGNDDAWFADCEVSQATFDTLVDAITGGRLRQLHVGLHLQNIYTDNDWAPPSMSADWFLRPRKPENTVDFPGMAFGKLVTFDATLASFDVRPKGGETPEVVEDVENDEPSAPMRDPRAEAIQALALHIEKLRGTVKWVGGLVAVFLAILAFR